MNDNEFTQFSDDELKSIHNCLTRQGTQYTSIKKKVPTIPNELALEVTMSDYQKDFDELVKNAIKK